MDPMLIAALVLGLTLGMRHATDADHVVAVSTIVSQSRSFLRASLIGVFWGLGHTATLFLAGVAVIFFRVSFLEEVSRFMEFAVGVMLVFLGWLVLRDYTPRLIGFLSRRFHSHEHQHEVGAHRHLHLHRAPEEPHAHRHGARTPRAAFVIGTIHGMAGSAALMLLVLTTIPSPLMGILYILLFGIGSIVGMLFISSAISLPFLFTALRFNRINQTIRIVAGTTSVILGLLLMGEVGSELLGLTGG